MDIGDSTIGKVVLVSTAGLFVALCVVVNAYPFIDEESVLGPYFPSPVWPLLCFALLWGLCLVGGLMAFTLYHLYPYL